MRTWVRHRGLYSVSFSVQGLQGSWFIAVKSENAGMNSVVCGMWRVWQWNNRTRIIQHNLWITARLSHISLICIVFDCVCVCSCARWFCSLSVCSWSGLCFDQWVFSAQGAAQGQNALLPETRGDRKPGPEGTRRRGLQVSSTLTYSDVTFRMTALRVQTISPSSFHFLQLLAAWLVHSTNVVHFLQHYFAS